MLDLKREADLAEAMARVAEADALIEGTPRRDGEARPGAGRLRRANPPLVYGRMTGCGQDGPLATT